MTKLTPTNEERLAELEKQAKDLNEVPREEDKIKRVNSFGREHSVYFESPQHVQKRQQVISQLLGNPALTLRDAIVLAKSQLDNDDVLLAMIRVAQQILKGM